jgi:hypothetical protein
MGLVFCVAVSHTPIYARARRASSEQSDGFQYNLGYFIQWTGCVSKMTARFFTMCEKVLLRIDDADRRVFPLFWISALRGVHSSND